MQNKDNDDIINSILKELEGSDSGKSAVSAEKNDKPENSSAAEESSSTRFFASAQPAEDSPQTEDGTADIPEKTAESQDNASAENAEQDSEVKIRRAPSNVQRRPQEQRSVHKKKKKKKKQRSRLPGVLILTTLIFAVSICLSLVIIAYGKEMWGIGKSETTHLIVIPEGATTEDISLMLEEEGIIKSPEFFQLFSKMSGSDAKYLPGEHFVRPNMAYETIIQELTSVENQKKESVAVTFPEGTTLYDAAYILQENGVCSAEDFIYWFNAGDLGFAFEDRLTSSSNLKFYRMEGFMFPDTYFFYVDMEPEQVCQKIYMNFNNKMESEVEIGGVTYANRYERMEQLNLSLDQLITFASIVQKEAATTESMTLVASVFWNRLNNSDTFPRLESDPTRIYAEDVIKPNMQVYDQVMIDAYNTYEGAGLPPGAICNPGTAAIDAVLEAYESEYFFFNANVNTGQTYYAVTLEEHNINLETVRQQIADAEAAAEQEGE